MTSRPPAQCLYCARWQSPFDRADPADEPVQICTAFPKGIPDDIWWNKSDHRQPHAGDHGLHWLARDGADFPEFAMSTATQ